MSYDVYVHVYNISFEHKLPMQSVPIATKVVSSNPIHGEMYSMQPNVIKFDSDLRQVSGFLPGTPVSSPIILTATISLKYC